MNNERDRTALNEVGPGVRPLNQLILSTQLDGSGQPRGTPSFPYRLDARNDLEVIDIWLSEVGKNKRTREFYLLEAERCLLWATVNQRKPLSCLSVEDTLEYERFLLDPQPQARWICSGRPPRGGDAWRPFRGPLSLRSAERSLTIVASFFKWMYVAGYIRTNPWRRPRERATMLRKRAAAPAMVLSKETPIVTIAEWNYIQKALGELEEREAYAGARLRTMLFLAYYAQLKPGEISALRTSSISVLNTETTSVWAVRVVGRPALTQEVVLLPPIQRALESYLAIRGLMSPSGPVTGNFPVIASAKEVADSPQMEAPLTTAGARWLAQQLFAKASNVAAREIDQLSARRLSMATLQWLSHAFEVHATQRRFRRNWCWDLLGARVLMPKVFDQYAQTRPPISIDMALEAFKELRVMWQ
jgi:integrase